MSMVIFQISKETIDYLINSFEKIREWFEKLKLISILN